MFRILSFPFRLCFRFVGFSRTSGGIAARRTIGFGRAHGPFVLVGTAPVDGVAYRALIRSQFASAQPPSFAPLLGAVDVAVVVVAAIAIAIGIVIVILSLYGRRC